MNHQFHFQVTKAAIFLFLAWCITSTAQTISPVSSVFTQAGKGDLTLTNNSFEPMIVTVEAVNFSMNSNQKIVRARLDPNVHVKFSQSGVRIAPKDSTHVFFEASADVYPAWFMIYATFKKATPEPGVKIAMQLGHPVYMYQKEAIGKEDVTIQKATFDTATHRLTVLLENHGDKLARPFVGFPQLHDSQYKLRLYPVFPRTTTTTSLDLSKDSVLKDVVLTDIMVEFDHFKLPSKVAAEESVPEKSAPQKNQISESRILQ